MANEAAHTLSVYSGQFLIASAIMIIRRLETVKGIHKFRKFHINASYTLNVIGQIGKNDFDKLQKIIRERLVKWRHDKGRFLFHMSSTVQRYKYICKEDGKYEIHI